MPAWYQWDGEDLILDIRLQPRASKNEIIGPHGDFLKIRTTAAPVDGKANQELIKLLAKTFRTASSAITLLAGNTRREKRVRIHAPRTVPDFIRR